MFDALCSYFKRARNAETRPGGTSQSGRQSGGTNGMRSSQGSRNTFVHPSAKMFSPAERDLRLRQFHVENPEGELCLVDTSNRNGGFYGPVWTKILSAYESGEYLRCRADMRRRSCTEDRFSGYTVKIDSVCAFLPASRASWFKDPRHDASRKCLAVKVEAVYPTGRKKGTVVVSAQQPLLDVFRTQPNVIPYPGNSVWALAMDHDGKTLIFPAGGNTTIRVPMFLAQEVAARVSRQSLNPDMLTGLYWRIRFVGKMHSEGADMYAAEPLELLV